MPNTMMISEIDEYPQLLAMADDYIVNRFTIQNRLREQGHCHIWFSGINAGFNLIMELLPSDKNISLSWQLRVELIAELGDSFHDDSTFPFNYCPWARYGKGDTARLLPLADTIEYDIAVELLVDDFRANCKEIREQWESELGYNIESCGGWGGIDTEYLPEMPDNAVILVRDGDPELYS